MGANQSIEAEKRRIESVQTMQNDINKLRELTGPSNPHPRSGIQNIIPADTFKESFD